MKLSRSSKEEGRGKPNLSIFGVQPVDPGYLYIFENGARFKIGKTNNPTNRIKEARTWIPDIKIVGIKPFWQAHRLERLLHSGLAQFWVGGEWFEFPDDTYDFLYEGFEEFHDGPDIVDRDWNSVDFIYWFNSSGMSELVMEQNSREISLKRWLKEAGSG